MTADVEAKDVKIGDKVLVEFVVVKIVPLPLSKRLSFVLVHADEMGDMRHVVTVHEDAAMEVHLP